MLVNTSGTSAVSNLGWLDAGSIWTYQFGEVSPSLIHISEAKWLSLVQGRQDYFAAVHEFEDGQVCVTAHSYEGVGETVSRIELDVNDMVNNPSKPTSRFTGDHSVWSYLPHTYVVNVNKDPFLLLVNPDKKYASLQALSWYKTSYDALYQGILGVSEVPASSLVIITVQRDSQPVIYDTARKTRVNKLKLADRSGNPELFFRRTAPELWASDYDTIVKLQPHTWNVLDVLKLQEGAGEMARLNLGKYCFDASETTCIVARPHSGDVVTIDSSTFRVTEQIKVEGQPLDIGVLRDNHFITRDWTTGQLERGVFGGA